MAVRARITRHEELRRATGLGVTAMAKRAGFSHGYVSQIEGGITRPSARYRRAAARVLAVPEAVLFDEDGRLR